MVIKHNMLAMYTSRNLNISDKKKKVPTERLSSGYRINRAADDAAGLNISEKMRGQIRGLNRASRNAQDGISLLNVADGALNEVQAILQRIRELAVQAANDTYVSEDRDAIQNEIDLLNNEVDRIGKSTEFNTIKLFQGNDAIITEKQTSVAYSKHQGVVNLWGGALNCGEHYKMGSGTYTLQSGITISDDSTKGTGGNIHYSYQLDFSNVKSKGDWNKLHNAGFTFVCTLGCKQEFTFKFDKNSSGIKDKTPNANIASGRKENSKVFTVGTSGYSTGEDFVRGLLSFISSIGGSGNTHVGHDNQIGTTNYSDLIVYGGKAGSNDDGYLVVGKPEITEIEVPAGGSDLKGKILDIQAGANTDQLIELIIPHIDSEELGMDRIRVTSSNEATESIGYVDEMIGIVSTERSRIGAYTNRLEYTYSNADNMEENLQSSESRIRDADMAEEMMDFSKNNIIMQAAQSLLAQVNSNTSNILGLLQG